MGNLHKSLRWRRHSEARRKYEAKRRLRFQRYLRGKRYSGVPPPVGSERAVTVLVPEVFSLIDNPEEMCRFLNATEQVHRRKRNVYADLRNIRILTSEAIVAFVSRINDPRFTHGMRTSGNLPRDPEILGMLENSDFYSYVHSAVTPRAEKQGSIIKQRGKRVEEERVADLITVATKFVFGAKKKLGGVYRTLIECMANTKDHAGGVEARTEHWYATVYYDKKREKACFAFLDNGVGIFKSIRLEGLKDKFSSILGLRKNTEILHEILTGKLGSRTRLSYRGKGLPSIFKVSERGQIHNLIIIANDVYANVERGEFRKLNNPFNGTFLYWEVSK